MARRSSNSHRHQRLNRYTGDVSKRRKRTSVGLWWIIPLSAIFAFVLAILLGNCLGSKVDEPSESTPPATEESAPSLPPSVSVEADSIDGIFVGLEGIYDNTYENVSKQIPEGTKAISLSMFYSNGAPLYYSEVAEECDKQSGELTLKNIFRYQKENGIYVSVPFPSSALSAHESPAASIDAAYEAELIKELCEAGANDVIIKCKYEALDDDFVLRIAGYISVLKITVPNLRVGFMISAEDAGKTAEIDSICDYADFCAVDMSSAENGETVKSLTEPLLTNILRYKMRVLISGTELDSKYAALDGLGIKNRQVVSK